MVAFALIVAKTSEKCNKAAMFKEKSCVYEIHGHPPHYPGKSRGRQITFTKTLDNKGFRKKLLKNF